MIIRNKQFNTHLSNVDTKKLVIDRIQLQYKHCNAVYDPMYGVYNSETSEVYFTVDDIDALVDAEMHKLDAVPVTPLEHNINKINKLVDDWDVIWVDGTASGIVDDPDYLPGYFCIDVDGFRGHRFYTYNEYTPLNNLGGTHHKLSDHSVQILSLILSDIDTGLWSVDMRFSNVLTLLNYMKPLVDMDIIEVIHKNRRPEDDDMYKIPDLNNLFEEA